MSKRRGTRLDTHKATPEADASDHEIKHVYVGEGGQPMESATGLSPAELDANDLEADDLT